jgi:two-component system chemotaxis response regulator CheB
MAGHDLIVIGASAGGIEALARLVRGLPPALPAALCIVCHVLADARSSLPEILSRSGRLLATHARDGEPVHPGHIYVAPPGHHLLLANGHVRLSPGPRENGHRPAIDPLFRSAARGYGPRVVGVILSGSMQDGVAGLLAVRAAGGAAVVQDPDDALVSCLPRSALQIAGADHVVPAATLPGLLADLVRGPAAPGGEQTMTDPIDRMPEAVSRDGEQQERGQRRGKLSVYTCPECGGSLWQVDEANLVRFRCHVGHVYHGEGLLEEQAQALEAALWTAVRTFEDRSRLGRQLAVQERGRGKTQAAGRFDEQAALAEHYGALIKQYLLNGLFGRMKDEG